MLNAVSWNSQSKWPNNFEGKGWEWPWFSIPAKRIPRFIFGANLLILLLLSRKAKFPRILRKKWLKWPWRSRAMIHIFNTNWEYPMKPVWSKFGDSSSNLWRVIMQTRWSLCRIISQYGMSQTLHYFDNYYFCFSITIPQILGPNLVILAKPNPNRWSLGLCDLKISGMTPKNNREALRSS